MNNFETSLEKLIADRERMGQLLTIEKERRGVSRESLVFVGMANVAKHWWCTQQAVLKSRANEKGFFVSYLHDRISYARKLGFVSKFPKKDKSLLDVGSEISFGDVNKLLEKETSKVGKSNIQNKLVSKDWFDSAGKKCRIISPFCGPETREYLEQTAIEENIRLIDLEDDPKLFGEIYEEEYAEKYPKIRWNFAWRHYSVVGVPDGVTANMVYEYKATASQFLFRFRKPVALTQADLYGFFFRRPHKRVQIQIQEGNETVTFEEAVDIKRAKETLAAFARVDSGEPARPPKPWKCSKCDFRSTCPISQAK